MLLQLYFPIYKLSCACLIDSVLTENCALQCQYVPLAPSFKSERGKSPLGPLSTLFLNSHFLGQLSRLLFLCYTGACYGWLLSADYICTRQLSKCIKCLCSHLRVAGLILSHGSFSKPFGKWEICGLCRVIQNRHLLWMKMCLGTSRTDYPHGISKV